MGNRKIAFSAALTALLVTGCAGTIPVNSYTPQNFVRFGGEAKVGEFSYQPAIDGKVADNQVQNTAIGKIFLPSKISDLVQRATALELEKTGITLGNGNIEVSGSVVEFKADDLGYSVDWTYSVRYIITDKTSGNVIVNKIFTAEPIKTGKFGLASDFSSSINDAILSGYNKFISDPDVKAALATK